MLNLISKFTRIKPSWLIAFGTLVVCCTLLGVGMVGYGLLWLIVIEAFKRI